MGPIFFLILINDIDQEVTSSVFLFTSDTRVMGPIKQEDDVENLQKDLEVKENLRDLGIIMSDNASFKKHIQKVCTSVTQKSSWILRTFQRRETPLMKFMWKTLVQGHIDYRLL